MIFTSYCITIFTTPYTRGSKKNHKNKVRLYFSIGIFGMEDEVKGITHFIMLESDYHF